MTAVGLPNSALGIESPVPCTAVFLNKPNRCRQQYYRYQEAIDTEYQQCQPIEERHLLSEALWHKRALEPLEYVSSLAISINELTV